MHSHSWMSRTEAAAHLRISVRQLDRLRLTRSYIGRRALYSREALDAHLLSLQTMLSLPKTPSVLDWPTGWARLERDARLPKAVGSAEV
jgi:hypothetical protein